MSEPSTVCRGRNATAAPLRQTAYAGSQANNKAKSTRCEPRHGTVESGRKRLQATLREDSGPNTRTRQTIVGNTTRRRCEDGSATAGRYAQGLRNPRSDNYGSGRRGIRHRQSDERLQGMWPLESYPRAADEPRRARHYTGIHSTTVNVQIDSCSVVRAPVQSASARV